MFFDWIVSFFDIELHELLCILEINPLPVALFANTFSHSATFLFVLFPLLFKSF